MLQQSGTYEGVTVPSKGFWQFFVSQRLSQLVQCLVEIQLLQQLLL